ncbi:Hypothetical predicted protein [Xyrichtys novacula]|uniref:Uncharacterized protein n=1 Tax=Xyrichtys novacula TaxID=13765 RepID=A0AAV1GFJ4_XYRNO|nr:Hypothetical predicted protein [Xyrichtys novacula]
MTTYSLQHILHITCIIDLKQRSVEEKETAPAFVDLFVCVAADEDAPTRARLLTSARVPHTGAHSRTCSLMHRTGTPDSARASACDRCLASPPLRWMFAQRTPATSGHCTDLCVGGTIQPVSSS